MPLICCLSRKALLLLCAFIAPLAWGDDDKSAVLAANNQFYEALNALFNGEVGPMKGVWSHEDDVTYLDPFGKRITGWPNVLSDWQKLAKLRLGGKVAPQQFHVFMGDELAVVQNYELGANMQEGGREFPISARSTNVFRKENGTWKLISHHVDPLHELSKLVKLDEQ